MKIIYGITALIMLWAATEDMRKQQISRSKLIILGVLCITGCGMSREQNWWSMAGGVAIGLCVIGISVIAKEQIGMGDGIIITVLGLMLGARQTLVLLCIASGIMTLVSLPVLIMHRGDRNTRLPFVPALFGGYLATLVIL